MNEEARTRSFLGRGLIASAQRLNERKADFHKWMIAAHAKLREPLLEPIVEEGRVVAVDMPLGRFALADQFVRQDGRLVARLVFHKSPTLTRPHPVAFYSVELHEDGTPYFGHVSPETEFEWSHGADDIWAPTNLLRLACELAISATEPR